MSLGLLAFSHRGGRLAGALNDAEDLLLAHDQKLLALELDLSAGILAEEDAIALPHIRFHARAVLKELSLAYGDDLALLRLLLGRIRDVETTRGLRLGLADP